MSGPAKALLARLTIVGIVWLARYLTGEGISIGRIGPHRLYLHATGIAKVQQASLCPILWDIDEEQASWENMMRPIFCLLCSACAGEAQRGVP